MQMGKRLMRDLKITYIQLNHLNFERAEQLVESNGETYFSDSIQDIDQALKQLYGDQEISLQQLSATFRRGDLIEKLNNIDVEIRR